MSAQLAKVLGQLVLYRKEELLRLGAKSLALPELSCTANGLFEDLQGFY